MQWLRSALLAALFVSIAPLSVLAQDKSKVGDSAYYPLNVGNTWSYKMGDMKYSLKVAKHEKVGDQMCARIELTVDNKIQAYEHVAIDKEGVTRYSYEGKLTEPPICILKLPPKKGQTWEVSAKVGGETLRGKLEEGEEKVKVPAGEYGTVTSKADDFDANGTKMAFKYFFAEKIGMVKQELDINGQKAIIELEKFEPGKAEPAKTEPSKSEPKKK